MEFRIVSLQTLPELTHHLSALTPLSYLALDLETAYWWKPHEEYIALLQLAYRLDTGEIEVLLLDIKALQSIDSLRSLLEDPNVTIAIHNASFDAIKLLRAFGIRTRAIYDTQRAARRAGAKRYSLAALVQEEFGVALDKAEQQSDWSQRPFTTSQLAYAAKDAVYTLLLYERQRERGFFGAYELPGQNDLPWVNPVSPPEEAALFVEAPITLPNCIDSLGLAALGLVVKKPNYYSPTSLVVAIGNERSGLAGWIVNTLLGATAEVEDQDARHSIAALLKLDLIRLDSYGRCEASTEGANLWLGSKPTSIP